MSRNNVRGPSSALTDFLREQGINAETIARRVGTRNVPVTNIETVQAPETREPHQTEAGPSRPRRGRAAADSTTRDEDSDHLDDEEEEEEPVKKKRKMTKAQEAKAKAAAKKAAKKQRGGNDSDDSDDGDSYNALSKALRNPGALKPAPGTFRDCVKCGKQFTVTIYTVASADGAGFLCHPCAKESGSDPFKKPKAKPARKREARQVVNFEEKHFPSLVSICINIVSQHINDVEALGGMASANMTGIAKAICKNRTLSPENAPLFYDVTNTTLNFSDATRLTPDALITLGSLNPNLVSLRLDYCGRINDDVLNAWSTLLSSLKRLELFGPFLIRVPAWVSFFESHPQLEGFLITQSPRFDVSCMAALANNCTNLQELRLKEVGKLDDTFIEPILGMRANNWSLLDLSDPTQSLSEDALVKLIQGVGANVKHLDLSGHSDLTDDVLRKGLHSYARSLTHLRLANTLSVTDQGIEDMFTQWENPPLQYIDLSRNPNLSGRSLESFITHSGSHLRSININGWRAVPNESLSHLGSQCPKLENIDLSWCREVDDFTVKAILEGCKPLKEIKAWACNRLSVDCPRRRGVNIAGVELPGIA